MPLLKFCDTPLSNQCDRQGQSEKWDIADIRRESVDSAFIILNIIW
jgi:hypothetical protein